MTDEINELTPKQIDEAIEIVENALTSITQQTRDTLKIIRDGRENIVKGLEGRADWLKSEYVNGGDYEHLRTREQECRAILQMIKDGRL